MKKMARLLSLVMILGLVLGTMAQASAESELVVWLTPSWKGVFSPDEEGADYDSFFKEVGRRFGETHPGVTVKVEVISGDSRDEKIAVAASTNTLPDIIYEGAFAMSSLYHKGLLVSLSDLITDEDRKDIAQGVWDNCVVNGDVFCYPFTQMMGTYVYNADLFRQAGLDEYIVEPYEIATWTPEQLLEICRVLKEKLPDKYPLTLFAQNTQGDTWTLCALRMFGNTFFNEDGMLCVNEESGVKALQYLVDMRNEGLTAPGPESLSSGDCLSLFSNQQLVIGHTNNVLLNNLLADMASGAVEKFDLRLANIPGDPTPHTFAYVSGGVVCNTGNEEKIALSKEFVKYFCTDPELLMATQNAMPVRSSVAEKLVEKLPYSPALTANGKYLINFSNNTPGYNELRTVLFPELQAAFTGEKTAQEALDSYVEKGNAIITEGRANSVVYAK